MAKGGPSHLIAGSSNPYGERPCATAEAEDRGCVQTHQRDDPSLARGTKATYVTHERPCCRLADVFTRTQPEACGAE